MKRLKLLTYAFAIASFFTLTSCGEDAILEEIIENTALGSPTLETEGQSDDDTPPSSN